MKRSQRDSIHGFERFFDDGLNYDVMLQQVREMIQIYLSRIYGNIIKFDCLTGLRRQSEAVASVQLISDKDDVIILTPLIFQNNHLENL
jgi:hypothetical protein